MQLDDMDYDKYSQEMESDSRIDPFTLHTCEAEQPLLYGKWARWYADVFGSMKECEHDLKILEAEASSYIRDNPEKYDLEKVTDKAIDALVTLDKEVKEKRKELLRWRKADKFFEAGKDAMDQRRTMLKTLSELWLGEYYSEIQQSDRGYEERFRRRRKEKLKTKGAE